MFGNPPYISKQTKESQKKLLKEAIKYVSALKELSVVSKAQVAERFGVSRTRVCQMHADGVHVLQRTAATVEVAYSLREMKHKSSIPYFVEGLNDEDQEVRYECMIALAETVGKFQDWAPSIPLFEVDEERYLNKWKQWWQEEGEERYGIKK